MVEEIAGLPRPVEALRPLGPRQYAFWMLQQLAPASSVSTLALAFRTTRPLRWWPLHVAVNHLVTRHPALRTRFPAPGGVPVRHVSAPADVELTVDVASATSHDLADRVREAARRPFDLAADLPLRLVLFQLADGGSAVLLLVHHIVSDAVSLALLIDELARAYDGAAEGGGVPADLQGEVPAVAEPPSSAEDRRFWTDHLRGIDTARGALPWGRPSPARPTFAGATLVVPMSAETVDAVEALRRRLRVTDNLVLLSAYYLTLFRHGAGPDLVLGVPVVGRGSGAAGGVGFAVSTLPLRAVVDPAASFADLTRQVRDAFLAGAQHASVSVEEVLAELGHHSPDWRVPLFRYLFNYRPWDESDVRIAGERPEFPQMVRDDSRLDIQLVVLGGRRPPVLLLNYSTEVHDEPDMAALLRRLEVLLRAAAEDPDRPVRDLELATPQERAVLAAANATRRPGRPPATVLDAVRAAARRAADVPAVLAEDAAVTYGDLMDAAGRASARLRAAGVRPGDVVGLALPRGAALAAAVLGVWGAGAAYLLLDAGQPRQRLVAQLSDAAARLVVTSDGAADLGVEGVPAVPWGELVNPDEPAGPPPASPGLDDPAYVMFTSGSTGRPRGVVVTHGNLANLIDDFAERLAMTPDDAVLWSTTTTFDISGLELFLPLTAGAPVVVAGREAQTRPRELLDLVVKHDVSVVQATPTFWRLALGELSGGELRGRTVLCGGEPMSADLARDLAGTGCRLLNVYGPTETTIWSTVAEIDGDVGDPVPIGRPLSNTEVFVRGEHGDELPPGLLGELCIAGAGVSAGYLGHPELTRDRFVTSPARGRHYRTGDLARWRTDGSLELFGRNDRQVKLRGHRIELPEVEAVLRACEEVADAAAVVHGDPQADGELRAFVKAAPTVPAAGLPDRVWAYLRDQLPAYALPSRVIVLDALPVSANGKTDLVALRTLEAASPTLEARADPDGADPDPALTQQLLALWRDTLGRPRLGERDHFFLNGGHSLLAAQLTSRIAEIVGEDVPVRAIFEHPTARQLSGRLTKARP